MRFFTHASYFGKIAFSALLWAGAAAAATPDFSGIWVPAEQKLVVRPDMNNPRYTPKAQAELDDLKANYDVKVTDPGRFCVPNGMPWLVATRAPFPVEILQSKEHVYMLYEAHSAVRRIFLDGRTKPADFMPTQDGFATGKWEGSTLVIETTGLSSRGPHVLLKRSEKARITERWNLIDHPVYGQAIEIKMVMDDPETFLEPRPSYQLLKRAPADTVFAEYDCANTTFWEPHLQQRAKEIAQKRASGVKGN